MRLSRVLACLLLANLGCLEPSKSARMLWRFPTPDSVGKPWFGIPAVDDGRVFVAVAAEMVALDAERGTVLWRTRIHEKNAIIENIVPQNGSLFTVSSDVMSLDAKTGAIRWRFPRDSISASCENAADSQSFFVGSHDHKVIALDVNSGAVKWATDIGPGWEFSSQVEGITISGDTVYVGAVRYLNQFGGIRAGVVAALDRVTGKLLWVYQTPETHDDVSSAPVVAGHLVLVSDLYGTSFFAVDRFTAERVWRVEGAPARFGPHAKPVVIGSQVYVGSNDEYVYNVDLESGHVVWRTLIRGAIGQFTVCGNTAFAQNFSLAAVDRHSGQLIWRDFQGHVEYPVSGFAHTADRVFVTGEKAVYAFACH